MTSQALHLVAHGVDLMEVQRIADLLERHPERAVARLFTPQEQAYCEASIKRRAEHYAARFAAKEAVLKALGTGWSGGIEWTDVEVVRAPSGEPGVLLHGQAATLAVRMGITEWKLSLSHTGSLAMASAIGLGTQQG